jgi:hypothetical protein
MDRARGHVPAIRRAGSLALITAFLAGCARVGKTTVSARQSASSRHAITATTDVGAIVVASSP